MEANRRTVPTDSGPVKPGSRLTPIESTIFQLSSGVSPGRILAWILVAAALLVAVLAVVFGPWDHDGGAYLLRGAYVADGLRPYIDYPSIYPPLVDLLTAGAVRLPLDRLPIAVLLPIAWIVAVSVASGCVATAGVWRSRRHTGSCCGRPPSR